MEIGNLPEKRIQNNGTEEDPRSWERNGGKEWDDIRSVYQRPRMNKEQTDRWIIN